MRDYLHSFSRSTLACIVGSMVLRMASSANGLMVGLYLAHISKRIHPISPIAVGLITGAFFATELLSAPVFGAYADRLGPRRFILLGPVFGLIAVQVLSLTHLVPVLLAARLIEGLATGSSAPATLSYLSQATDRSATERGRTMSLFELGTLVGIAGGLTIGGPLWEVMRARAFNAIGIGYTASIFVFLLVQNPERVAVARRESLLSVVKRPSVLRFVPAWVAVNASLGLWFSHTGFQLSGGNARANQFLTWGKAGEGFPATRISLIFLVYTLVFALGVWLWGFAFSRLRSVDIMLIGTGGILVACAAVYGINHSRGLPFPSLQVLLLLLCLAILVESGFTPAALSYLADIGAEHGSARGSIMGLYSVFLGLGQLLGSLLGGPATKWAGVDGMVALTVALAGLALYAVSRLRLPLQPPQGTRGPAFA